MKDLKKKLKDLFKLPNLRKKKKTVETPKQWVKGKKNIKIPKAKKAGDMVTLEMVSRKKYRVPGLRRFNQVLAGAFIIVNFLISQAALTSATPEVGFLFLVNSYLLIWGLWKSRKEKQKIEV